MLAAVLSIAVQGAFADTIHLKNGRTIRTETARVDGDEVVFQQFGSEVRIPAALVARIVKDDQTEVFVVPPPGDSVPRSDAPETAESKKTPSDARRRGERDEAQEPSSKDSRGYWQDRVLAVYAEQAQLQTNIEEWRRDQRGSLFSHRSTEATRLKIDAALERIKELDQKFSAMRREARREGIPPGWLRVARPSSS